MMRRQTAAPARARRMPSSERLARCRAIRDAALAVLRRQGVMEMTGGRTPLRVMRADWGDLLMVLNTPFTPRPAPSPAEHYLLAQAGRRPMLPYALDLWHQRRKVFAVSWNDGDTELEVMTFRNGAWTGPLLAQEDQAGPRGSVEPCAATRPS